MNALFKALSAQDAGRIHSAVSTTICRLSISKCSTTVEWGIVRCLETVEYIYRTLTLGDKLIQQTEQIFLTKPTM